MNEGDKVLSPFLDALAPVDNTGDKRFTINSIISAGVYKAGKKNVYKMYKERGRVTGDLHWAN